MVQMSVRQQDAIKPAEAKPTAQQLPLCALTAVDEKAILFVEHHRGRQPTMH
jgi:hypothetical protein